MNKQDAAKFLGVSERTVAAYAANGRLPVRYVKGKTRDVADYDDADLARLKEFPNAETVNLAARNREAANLETAIVVQPAFPFQKSEPETLQGGVSMFVLTDEQVSRLGGNPSVELAARPLLTFAEAAEFTGISEKLLREAGRVGQLKARKIGRSQRIRKVDLTAWIDGQFD